MLAPMGFYIDLIPSKDGTEYHEEAPPAVFWVLWAFAGFALLCMGLSAYAFLGDLLREGFWFDRLAVGLIIAAVPIYLLVGLKLAFVRRFIRMESETLIIGFDVAAKKIAKRIQRADVKSVDLVNQTTSPNQAQKEHDDPQYHYRGHWKVVATLQDGRQVLIDRNTERGNLRNVLRNVEAWFTSRPEKSGPL